MKLAVGKAALVKALGHIHRVVEKRTVIPILSNILLRAGNGALELRGTDLDIEVVETVPAAIGEPGATTVPGHMLHDIVRKLPDGVQVAIEGDGDSLTIKAGRSRFKLQTLPVDDFPTLEAGGFAVNFAVPAATLVSLFGRAQFAISTEETRFYLNGVYLHIPEGGDKLRAVATDGHRLAKIEVPAPEGAAGMPGVIVPRKTVAEVTRQLGDVEGDVAVSLSTSKIRFAFGSVVLTSKLVDGTFPDYERVIPAANNKRLLVNRKALADAVSRVATVLEAKGSKAVKLSADAGTLALSVVNAEAGHADEAVDADYDAPAIEIGFSASYLDSILSELGAGNVEIMLESPGSPTLFSAEGDASALFVLMPMRV